MNIFFTSDMHIRHKNILTYCKRPFTSLEEMEEGLIKNWNEIVKSNDLVYNLGDYCFGPNKSETVKHINSRLNGTKILIPGNHDACFHGDRKHIQNKEKLNVRIRQYMDAGFSSVCSDLKVIFGSEFKLAHLPYEDEQDFFQGTNIVRYKEARLPDQGIPLIHGHVHENWLTRKTSKGTLMINVGVDSPAPWYMRPAHLDEVLAVYHANI